MRGAYVPEISIAKSLYVPRSDFVTQAFPFAFVKRLEACRLVGTQIARKEMEEGPTLIERAKDCAIASRRSDERIDVPSLPSLYEQDVRREHRQESGQEVMESVRSVRGKTSTLDGRALELRIQIATKPRLCAVLVAAHEAGAELHRLRAVLRGEVLDASKQPIQRFLRIPNDAGYRVLLIERDALVVDSGDDFCRYCATVLAER